ncbi:FMN-dependent NADH-azoreductase [Actinoplanes italicus]|uniref:FMN dependent NADH:quinone oxidoreductase n=1 Tax=Actinoplanes italicus TaxID=113567 RepID=A0A2T0K138_9ACTN|nr:NAD(P)H-dependent oxidoreductase [Actinoplanes italicus]PRX16508.1 FMN-dependent NADH-azoreductase [Actinoplanes italicus]GIE33714.1 FMN-dependent NADH-azoreductase [Actinoplanes italicus]
MNLLHISASPRGPRSESLAVAATFLDTVREVSPDAAVEQWDLWDGTLPAFGPDAVTGKMAVFAGGQPEGDAAVAWEAASATFRRFDAADTYLFSVPMWNAGIPYILKQLIDVVSQPGMVFGFDPEQGYSGLLRGKRAAVIYTSAVYGPGRPPAFGADFQAPYFEDWLRWAGVTDISTVHFRPNLATADAATARRTAHDQARDLAKVLTAGS